MLNEYKMHCMQQTGKVVPLGYSDRSGYPKLKLRIFASARGAGHPWFKTSLRNLGPKKSSNIWQKIEEYTFFGFSTWSTPLRATDRKSRGSLEIN